MKPKIALISFLALCVLSLCIFSLYVTYHPPQALTKALNDPFPLHTAAVHYPEKNADLVLGGVDIHSLNDSGHTALQMAVTFRKKDSVRQLLAAGANPNAGQSQYAPLAIAARSGGIEIVKMLLMHGANPNGKDYDKTALHNAAIFGHADIARLLVACENIDLNVQESGTGYTPLHYAVQHEHMDVISVLLQEGINTHTKDNAGNTSLVLARFKSNKDIAALLEESEREHR